MLWVRVCSELLGSVIYVYKILPDENRALKLEILVCNIVCNACQLIIFFPLLMLACKIHQIERSNNLVGEV